MKVIFKGRYNGKPETLPCEKIRDGSNKIIEIKNSMTILSIFSIIILLILLLIFRLRVGGFNVSNIGVILFILSVLPHELIHAIAFKEPVYLYFHIPFGVFIYCQEKISKLKYIIMCLLPNIIFGFIPFIMFLIFPELNILGTMGMIAITGGVGDYYNVYNAIKQVPNKATMYMNKMDTYWYV